MGKQCGVAPGVLADVRHTGVQVFVGHVSALAGFVLEIEDWPIRTYPGVSGRMFYSEFVLAKKGALGKVWLAAHWEKKLTRTQMSKSNITEACASIIKVGPTKNVETVIMSKGFHAPGVTSSRNLRDCHHFVILRHWFCTGFTLQQVCRALNFLFFLFFLWSRNVLLNSHTFGPTSLATLFPGESPALFHLPCGSILLSRACVAPSDALTTLSPSFFPLSPIAGSASCAPYFRAFAAWCCPDPRREAKVVDARLLRCVGQDQARLPVRCKI